MLFDTTRHEKLTDKEWSESAVLEVVDQVFQNTLDQFDPKTLWPAHKDEESIKPYNKSLYLGAAGTVWGLNQISLSRGRGLSFDAAEVMEYILQEYRRDPDTDSIVPSYFLGEVGVLLTHYKFSEAAEIADKIYESVSENISNPVNEALWGCPGTMLAALFMHQWTGNEKWKQLFNKNAEYLFSQWHLNENDQWVWTQDLYGAQRQLVGAGHGFFGNVFPLLLGRELLGEKEQAQLLDRVAATAIGSVEIEGDKANWPVTFTGDDGRRLVQWCHGSPGVITSMGPYPLNHSAKLEELLVQAGELVWQAGPLKKGIALCHGADGNGYAFLKLYKRTGESQWLDRARSFAMHAIEQRNDRYGLWTGEIGLACYLLSCVSKDDAFPTMDRF